MEYREFDTSITYKSNCHYEETSDNQIVKLPLRKVNIVFSTFIDAIRNTTNLYYNDPITINITIIDEITNDIVQWGNVIFYYIDKDDIGQQKQQINATPIQVDVNGNASIQYIPHNDGKFYVEYYGEPYYEKCTVTQNIPTLLPRPTHINFTKLSPYLVDSFETINMEVSVKDDYTNEPLDYGIVTFLNYHTYDINLSNDGYEKVIGNPRYLINGKANITYSPIQLNTNDLYHNIELIRASYNYDNELYGVQWKYYKEHNDYTAIAIRKDNYVNLAIPQTQQNNEYSIIPCNDEGMFTISENNPIICQCQINVSNTIITNAQVIFIVEGYYYTYENDIPIKNDYQQVYDNVSLLTKNDEKYFEVIIPQLREGIYEIYAQVQNPIIEIENEEYELPVYNSELENTPTTNINSELIGNKIIDGIYLKSNKSESIYIKITPNTNKLNLTLNITKPVITTSTLSKNNIYVTIDTSNLTNDDINVLRNKECYFYIPALNKTYTGIIQYTDNELKAQPSSNITLQAINDYVIYAYILGKTYAYENVTRQYNTTYSNSEIIKRRNQLEISLRLNTIDTTYPGKIQYILNVDNIDNDIINVDIYIDNHIITTHSLTKINSSISNYIPVQNVGTHTIKAKINTTGFQSLNAEQTFTIEKANLNINLDDNSKNIFTTLQSDVWFNVKNSKEYDIGVLDKTKFSPIFKKNNNQQDKNDLAINTQNNNNNYIVSVIGKIYDSGEWQVKLDYDGDTNYNATNNNFTTIQAINQNPYCVNINIDTNNDTITNQIAYAQNTTIKEEIINNNTVIVEHTDFDTINQNILVISKLLDNEENIIGTITSITDINGEYTLSRANTNISDVNWSKCSTIEYEIVPKNNILNAFSNITENNEEEEKAKAKIAFHNQFNNYQGTDTDIINLYNQAKDYYFVNLFLGYDYVKDTINLYGDE